MPTIRKAEDVFRDLSREEKNRIFKIAEGKTVYFPKLNKKGVVDREAIVEAFMRGGQTQGEIAGAFEITPARVCQIIAKERGARTEERMEFWHNQKRISLRVLGNFYGRSHETIRRRSAEKEGDRINEEEKT